MKSCILFCLLITLGVTCSKKERISGGANVDSTKFAASYGFVVSIQYDNKHICAGSVLRGKNAASAEVVTNYVVTAAHCVVGLDIGKIIIRSGSAKISSATVRRVDASWIHSGYNPNTYQHDIAVLKMTGTAPIMTGTVNSENLDDMAGVILGWGATAGGEILPVTTLKEASVQSVPHDDCAKIYSITDEMMCTEQRQNAACYGDGGGPFLVTKPQATSPTLVGIISWGSSCNSANPKVLTRVSAYEDWLRPFVKNQP